MSDEPEVSVRHEPEAHRYTVYYGDRAAGFVQYRDVAEGVNMVHTEVDDAFEGHGLGSALARGALDDVRREGRQVVPQCPFIAAFVRKHPDYLDVVAESYRDELRS